MKIAVVLCAFGLLSMTDASVDDALREPDIADVYVVDNAGTYRQHGREKVIRPESNLGWLGGSNAGVEAAAAAETDYDGYLLLNNDTRLSDGFVAGMATAMTELGAGIVAPVYDDDSLAQQHIDFFGPASTYRPVARSHEAIFVDGTALLLSETARQRVGILDSERFGRHGWGADIDLALRVRQAGLPVVVTERAFVNHLREGSFDPSGVEQYRIDATAEMEEGMRAKWGPRWRELAGFPTDEEPTDARPRLRRALGRLARALPGSESGTHLRLAAQRGRSSRNRSSSA